MFNRAEHADVFKQERLASSQLWAESRRGQHVELGIAENNLFLMLAALGMSGPLFGQRLILIGTLYDPFIARGLDALTYASYQDARFLLVATPSGISLAPEGGAHQSVATPLIGIGQPELLSFEPAPTRTSLRRSSASPSSTCKATMAARSICAVDEDDRAAGTRDDRRPESGGPVWRLLAAPAGARARVALVGAGAICPSRWTPPIRSLDDLPDLGNLVITRPTGCSRTGAMCRSGGRRARPPAP